MTEYNEFIEKVDNTNNTDIIDLVKKNSYNKKINEIERKITDHDHAEYITTQEFNK